MDRRVPAGILLITGVALAARLVALGGRPFHWSEARVGYWALRFAETGVYEYRPVTGGPLVTLLTRWVVAVAGASDASARVPIALVGGLAPTLAWWFRGVLDETETLAFAGLLAADPLLLYYSRFLRGDVLAAVFGLAVVGALVRYRTERRDGWLVVAGVAFALAVGASGFAVTYPLIWLAAGAFTLDETRVRGVPTAARETLADWRVRLAASVRPVAAAGVASVVVGLFLFAPRGGGVTPGVWQPTTWPAAVDAAVAATDRFVGVRIVYRLDPLTPGRHGLVSYLRDILAPLVAVSVATLGTAVVGFFVERYGTNTRRTVAFAGYTVPLGAFVFAVTAATPAPWVGVHLLPLAALPGAVGLAAVWRGLRSRTTAGDAGRVVLAAALVVAGLGVGGTPVYGVYEPTDRDSPFAQYAQPTDDTEELLPVMADAMERAGGPDVVYVGQRFATSQEYDRPPIARVDRNAWGARFPLPWYFERLSAGTTSVGEPAALPGQPAVVVAGPGQADAVAQQLGQNYQRERLQLATYRRPVVVFVYRG